MEYSSVLVNAVYACDKYKVHKLVKPGTYVNCNDRNNASVVAARCAEETCSFRSSFGKLTYNKTVFDYINIYKSLQDAGADTRAEDNYGHTARYYLQKLLWRSCEFACPEVVTSLADIGGIYQDVSRMCCTPLCHIGKSEEYCGRWAADIDKRWCDTLNLLQKSMDFRHSGSCVSEILYRSCKYPLFNTVKTLLSIPAIDVNYRQAEDMSKTPIMALACLDNLVCACCEEEIGESVEIDGPLTEALSLLLDHGADTKICDRNEVSASTYLSKMLCESVSLLYENVTKRLVGVPGVDVNYKNKNQSQPLTLVGKGCGYHDNAAANIYEVLLEKITDVPWKYLSEELHRHVFDIRTHTVKKLLTFPQVDVNYCLNGRTPIMNAMSEEGYDEECCELYDVLIQAGALNYSKSDELWKSLAESMHAHVEKMRTQTVRKLVSFPQLDVNYCLNGKTPIMVVGLGDDSNMIAQDRFIIQAWRRNVDDEKFSELYDVLIQAGALNYIQSDELWKSLSESLYRHAYFVRPQTMKKLVSFPQVNVNYCLNGETPIMAVGLWCSEDDACCKVYDTLIKAGALNYSNSDELWNSLSHSLHRHAGMALPKTVKKLLTLQQVNVNFCWNGKTPIMIVGCHSDSDEQCAEVYDELIKAGALKHSKSEDLCRQLAAAICLSAREKRVKSLGRLLSIPGINNCVNYIDSYGKTPIMEVGDYFGGKDDENIANIYDLLANNGADLKAADNNGKSARQYLVKRLETATKSGHFKQMEKLWDILGFSNDLSNFPVSLRKTMHDQLICKSEEGNAEVVKRIMQFQHVDVNHKGKDGITAVMVVGKLKGTDKECSEIYDVLLTHDDTLIAEDYYGKPALEYLGEALVNACAWGHIHIFQSLLEAKIDTTCRYKGMTPLTAIGVWGGTDDVCEAMYVKLLSPTIDNSERLIVDLNKAFHRAATKCWYKVMKWLMYEPYIDPNKVAEDGTIPLTVVAQNGGSDEACCASYKTLLPKCNLRFQFHEAHQLEIHKMLSEALWSASRRCWPLTVELLANTNRVDVNFRGNSGTTPIMVIDMTSGTNVDDTCSSIYSVLLSRCDINLKDNRGKSALKYLAEALEKAASCCYHKVCEAILSHAHMVSVPLDVVDKTIDHFDINGEDDRKCADTYRVLFQHMKNGKLLIRNHLSRALLKAARWGWNRVVDILTVPDVIQNDLIDLNQTDESNKTAIMNLDWGCKNFEKAVAIFSLLRERGADLTVGDYTATSVSGEISSELCQSVKMNHQYKVKVLLDLPGININFKKNGKVPLMHIQWSDRLLEDCMQIEELLLSRNANIDAVDDQGVAARLYPSMALWRALVNGAEDVAVNLLKHKRVDVNYQHNFESIEAIKSLKINLSLKRLSILHVAALACYPQIVKLLLQRGANPLFEDVNGRTTRTLLAQNYFYLHNKYRETADEILNILYYEEMKITTPIQEPAVVAVPLHAVASTLPAGNQIQSLEEAQILEQEQFLTIQRDSDIFRHNIRESEISTGKEVFQEPLNLTSDTTWVADEQMIQSVSKEDVIVQDVMENVTVTAMNTLDRSKTHEIMVKDVGNGKLLPLLDSDMPTLFGNKQGSVLSKTASVKATEDKHFVHKESENGDALSVELQGAADFQSDPTFNYHKSSGEQGTDNPNQVGSTCKLQQKENESHNQSTTELFKQDATPKELLEVKKLNKNVKQNNTSTSQIQSHKETNGKKQRMSHTAETATSGWFNFSDPIKKDVKEFITKSGFHCDKSKILPSLKRMQNNARSVVRCLIGLFFTEDILAASSLYKDYSKYDELDHNIVETCIAFVQQKYATVSRECILDTINQKCADARKKPKFKPKADVVQFQVPRSKLPSPRHHNTEPSKSSTPGQALTTYVTTSTRSIVLESYGDDINVGSEITCKRNGRSSRSQIVQRKGSFSLANKNCHFVANGQNSFNFHNCTVIFNNTKCHDVPPQETPAMANADSFTGASPVTLSTSVPSSSFQSSDSSIQGANNCQEQSVKRKQNIFDGETEDYTKKQKH